MASFSQPQGIHSGPVDPSLLTMQETHVSHHIWNGKEDRILTVRRSHFQHRGSLSIPEVIIPYLERAGFKGVAQLSFFQIDHNLISALVERWRPETHTFHMPPGECTITLQDVAVQVGLQIDGKPVTGQTVDEWSPLLKRLLGISPPESQLQGGRLRMRWLDENFGDINKHISNEVHIEHFARAYILRLIGGIMFPDLSGRYVHLRYLTLLEDFDEAGRYSWGSAVLSYLYRELCNATDYERKEISGLCALIQLWAWDRFPSIAPKKPTQPMTNSPFGSRWIGGTSFVASRRDLSYYRYKFDRLKRTDIVWEPYTNQILFALPTICLHGIGIWRAVVPMICYHIVEWHQPDRVMRQFGMTQHIPSSPCQPDYLHDITLRGKNTENWVENHRQYIQIWENRRNLVQTNDRQNGLLAANSEYMKWYSRHTNRWITKDGARTGAIGESLERLHFYATDEKHTGFTWDLLKKEVEEMLFHLNELDRISEPSVPAPSPSQHFTMPEVNPNIPASRVEGRGLQRRRKRENGQYYFPSPNPVFPYQATTYYYPLQDPATFSLSSHTVCPVEVPSSSSHTCLPSVKTEPLSNDGEV